MISNDVNRSIAELLDLDEGEPDTGARKVMLFRQQAAFFFEAAKFIAVSTTRFHEIHDFIAGLPPEGRADRERVCGGVEPKSPYYLGDWLGRHRNGTFHYSEMHPDKAAHGKEEITLALEDAAESQGTVYSESGDELGSVRFGFADTVASWWLPPVEENPATLVALRDALTNGACSLDTACLGGVPGAEARMDLHRSTLNSTAVPSFQAGTAPGQEPLERYEGASDLKLDAPVEESGPAEAGTPRPKVAARATKGLAPGYDRARSAPRSLGRCVSRRVHSLRAEQFRSWTVKFSARAVVLADCSLVVPARAAQGDLAPRLHVCERRTDTAHRAARQSDIAGRHSRRRVVARQDPGTPATDLVLARRSGARRRRVSRRA
jgi:hypothetical protein